MDSTLKRRAAHAGIALLALVVLAGVCSLAPALAAASPRYARVESY